MEALLAAWTHGLDTLELRDEASVALVRQHVREVARGAGFAATDVECVATAASELAHNQLAHARLGVVGVRVVTRLGMAGVELVAADSGAGMRNVPRALGGMPPSRSLGVGLASVRRLCDELDLDNRAGEGCCLRARKFAGDIKARSEVGVAGRAHAGERVNGDGAVVVRDDATVLVAVADGLGHGPAARVASDRALAVVVERAAESLLDILRACDVALARTRGAVMAIARLDLASRTLVHAGAGNVTLQVIARRRARRFDGSPTLLGTGRGTLRRPIETHLELERHDVVVLASDGLRARAALTEDPQLLQEHPAATAARLVEAHGRDNDDVMVAVLR